MGIAEEHGTWWTFLNKTEILAVFYILLMEGTLNFN